MSAPTSPPNDTPTGPQTISPLLHLSQLVNKIRRTGGRAYRSTVKVTNNRQCKETEQSRSRSNPQCYSTPRRRNKNMNKQQDSDETIVKELFKPWEPSDVNRSINTSDDDITLVKERFTTSTNNDTEIGIENVSNCDVDLDQRLGKMRRENKELQESLKDLFSQTKILKNENDSLVKLVESKDNENKKLRSKISEVTLEKDKIESALSRTKGDLTEANAQLLIYEQDVAKQRKLNESLTIEKKKMLEQMMKTTGASDSVEHKIEKTSENLENKVAHEIHELKRLLLKELDDVKSQIKKSQAVRSSTNFNKTTATNEKSTTNRPTLASNSAPSRATKNDSPKQIPTIVSNRSDQKPNQQSRVKQKTVFIAGDSMTRILSSAKLSDDKLNARIKSHPGGRVRTIEKTLTSMINTDHAKFKELDAIVIHVGTNNISEGDNCESILDEFRDSIHTIKSAHPNVKIIVSSVLPRQRDRLINDMIQKTNASLQAMCQEDGHYFLNNSTAFVHQGNVDASLYRDNIHLNAKGGKTLGTGIRAALNKVLDINQSPQLLEASPSFHKGRYSGRRTFNNNRDMVFMPVPKYLLNNQNPWFVPNLFWN